MDILKRWKMKQKGDEPKLIIKEDEEQMSQVFKKRGGDMTERQIELRPMKEEVIRLKKEHPEYTVRSISNNTGVAAPTVWRWLLKESLIERSRVKEREVTPATISNDIRKKKRLRPPKSRGVIEEIKRLYLVEGLNSYEIGKMYSVHHGSILTSLRREGVQVRPRGSRKYIKIDNIVNNQTLGAAVTSIPSAEEYAGAVFNLMKKQDIKIIYLNKELDAAQSLIMEINQEAVRLREDNKILNSKLVSQQQARDSVMVQMQEMLGRSD